MKRQLIITVIATVLVLTLGIVCETASYRISTAYRQRILTVGAALGRGNWQDALQRTLEISSNGKSGAASCSCGSTTAIPIR